MTGNSAIAGAVIFDGDVRHHGAALIVKDGRVGGIVQEAAIPGDAAVTRLDGGLLAPGFVDLQVNGGGGVLFNGQPDLAAIETICKAHIPFGTTSLLATLITDTPDVTSAAIAASILALEEDVPGFLGLHLEGPHLSVAKKGAHNPAFIRKMTDGDHEELLDAARQMPCFMVTLAPESVTRVQISSLDDAGICVSLGHSDAAYSDALAAANAGASAVTHLFNAMSPLTHREPGLVGAALQTGHLNAGLIADGIHVDPAVIAIALRAKTGPGNIFLVTDAMATIGTDLKSFELNGRTIHRQDGRLTLDDGTLAGADLDMISAVNFMASTGGVDFDQALRMASLYPAMAIGADDRGQLSEGARADIVHLTDSHDIARVWIGGDEVYHARA